MRLQIVMDGDARRALYESGYLAGDKSRITFDGFEPAYQWMSGQMVDMIAPPSEGVDPWPMWAWYKRGELGRVDPNSDEYADQDLWVLTFDANAENVVLSDFEGWHYVLNGWYLPDLSVADGGEAEDEAFNNDLEAAGVEWAERPYPEPFNQRVLDSWRRIFDISENSPGIQATFWTLHASQVIAEEPCIGTVRSMELKCA